MWELIFFKNCSQFLTHKYLSVHFCFLNVHTIAAKSSINAFVLENVEYYITPGSEFDLWSLDLNIEPNKYTNWYDSKIKYSLDIVWKWFLCNTWPWPLVDWLTSKLICFFIPWRRTSWMIVSQSLPYIAETYVIIKNPASLTFDPKIRRYLLFFPGIQYTNFNDHRSNNPLDIVWKKIII